MRNIRLNVRKTIWRKGKILGGLEMKGLETSSPSSVGDEEIGIHG